MHAVVVYESMYGNTHTVAERIGAGLAPLGDVRVLPVSEATDEVVGSADLLVVGGPTHVHGMTRESTRHDAVQRMEQQGGDLELDPDAEGPGLREWFDTLGRVEGTAAAAYDTRVGEMSTVMTGRASKGIHKRLRRHGFATLVDPESFGVDKETHLMAGEEERAEQWGAALAEQVMGDTRP